MKDSKEYVEIDLDKIEYAGETKNEKKLNKELLSTTLELNYFQDSYDCMRSVDEIAEKIKELENISNQDESNTNLLDIKDAKSKIEILKWVLNGSHTIKEKESKYPKASKEDVERILNNFKELGK